MKQNIDLRNNSSRQPTLRLAAITLMAAMAICGAVFAVSPVWTRTYNGAADDWDSVEDLALDSNGNIYAVGYTYSATNGSDIWIRKYTSSGVKKWTRIINGNANDNDRAYGAVVDGSDNLYVVGEIHQTGEDTNIWIRKYSSSGAKKWTRIVDGPAGGFDGANGVALDAAGNLYVVGYATKTGESYDIWIRKYDTSGTKKWTRMVNGPADDSDEARGIALDSSGNLYVIGHVTVPGAQQNIWIRKYSAAGAKKWTRTVNGSASISRDRGHGIAVAASGAVYAVGKIDVTDEGENIWIRKYSSAGVKKWTRTIDGSPSEDDVAFDATVDSAGNLYVTGFKNVTDQSNDIWTRKYGSSGVTKWTRTVNGPLGVSDMGKAVVVNASGKVYVGGFVSVADEGHNAWIRKYSQ